MNNPLIYKKNAGFTLIELMIVVVIIAILTAIAMPSYQNYVQQTRRADAQSTLMELAHFLERHYTIQGKYTDAVLPFNKSPKDGSSTMYNLSLAEQKANSYKLQAVPAGSMAGDKCGTLTLDYLGNKKSSSATVAECWKQ